MAVEIGRGEVVVEGNFDRFTKDVKRQAGDVGDKAGRDFSSGFSGHLKSLGAAIGGAVAITAGVQFLKGAVGAASDLNETVSKSRTIFGPAAADLEKWAGGAAKAMGQSKQQALDAAGTFGNLFVQLGVGTGQAAKMSKQMVELASDFASFHNANPEDVIMAQTAAFRGEYDALQRFVPTINAAAVEQEALAMTGKKATKELTLQEKALAVQALMMKGAGDATGDFARTSDGLANKQRILSASIADLKTKLGNVLLPVVSTITGFLSDKMLPAFNSLGQTVAPIAAAIGAFFNTLTSGFTEDEGTPIERFALRVRELFFAFVDTLRTKVLPIVGNLVTFARDNLLPIVAALAAVFIDRVVPAVGLVIGKLLELAGMVSRNEDLMKAIVIAIGVLLVPAFVAWAIAAGSAAVATIAATLPVIAIGAAVAGLAYLVIHNWDTIKNAFRVAKDFILEHLDKILIVGLGPLGVAIVGLRHNWETVWSAIQKAVEVAWDIIRPIIDTMRDAIKTVTGLVDKLPGKGLLGGAASAVAGPFGGLIGNANGVRGWMGGPSVVGERGPELLDLPAGTDVYSNGETNGILAELRAIRKEMEKTRRDNWSLART